MNSNFIQAKTAVYQAIVPAATVAAGTQTSAAFDKSVLPIHHEGLVVFQTGAASGSPDSLTVTCKIQHSDDDGATDAYADVTDLNIVEAATKAISAASSIATFAVRPDGLKQYFKILLTTAFVNGTSPHVFTTATYIAAKLRDV